MNNQSIKPENDIRDSMNKQMLRFKLVQRFVTILTGKPHTGQKSFQFSPWYYLISIGMLPIIAGVLTSIFAIETAHWLFLLPGWFLTLSGMRVLRLQVMHYASHGFIGNHAIRMNLMIDILLGEVISIVLLTDNFPDYAAEHIKDHHGKGHMTMADPTVRALIMRIGLCPGKPLRWQQRRLLMTLLSPLFHLAYTKARIQGHYTLSPIPKLKYVTRYPVPRWLHIVLSTIYLALLLGISIVTNHVLVLLLAWVLPLTVFFQISTSLRLSTKHRFPKPGPRLRSKEELAGFTTGIFMGEAMPSFTWRSPLSILCWSGWLLRMLVIHYPSRALVIVGDAVTHDLHHRYGEPEVWTDFIFRRQTALEQVDSKWPVPYAEVWGLKNAVNAVLQSISDADPAMFQIKPRHERGADQLFGSMDD